MTLWLADAILVIHFAFVLGVIVPVPLILLGSWRGWGWVRNRWFRRTHLAMIGIVASESLIGALCPLTEWEQALRERAGDASYTGSFIEHWLSRLIYYEFEPWVFTIAYVLFAMLIAALYIFIPPQKKT